MTAERSKRRGLSEQERAEALARLEEFERRYAEIPDQERVPITNPEKFAGPVGGDPDGDIPTYRRVEDVPES